MQTYSFNVYSKEIEQGICNSLKALIKSSSVVIVCIGTDLVVGDSLGPYTGSILTESKINNVVVYGTLEYPITAKETKTLTNLIRKIHPSAKILVIDAAVGKSEDIGTIKISNTSIKPGLGVNKNLDEIGDISIIGIVHTKSQSFENIVNSTRLNLVVKMANVIKNGITKCLS